MEPQGTARKQTFPEEAVQNLVEEILRGVKTRLFQPVWEELGRLNQRLEELQAGQQAGFGEVRTSLAFLATRIEESPAMVLTAIRDAVDRAGQGD